MRDEAANGSQDRPDHNGRPLLVLCDFAHEPRLNWRHSSEFIGALVYFIDRARKANFPVAYCESYGFSKRGWPRALAQCRPRTKDMVFERQTASCFGNSQFREIATLFRDCGILFAGLNAEIGVLASVLDSFHLGIRSNVMIDLCGRSYESGDGSFQGLFGMTVLVKHLDLDIESATVLSSLE